MNRTAAEIRDVIASAFVDPETGFFLDINGMRLDTSAVTRLVGSPDDRRKSPLARAHREMKRLEAGAVKNPDEGRKVTHFTDRQNYPDTRLYRKVERFAAQVREGRVPAVGPSVEAVVVNGIGGSALGPQLVQFALNGPYWNEWSRKQRCGYPRIYFLDNTDAAGFVDVIRTIDLKRTLVVSISKSGGTIETANNLIAFQNAYAARKLSFARHAVAITMPGSKLDRLARREKWLIRFALADSIGGRTSETNIVGHLPAALTGIDFASFLAGARHMDDLTRRPGIARNPAYRLAVAWYVAGNGRGDRNMVVVPYADRLVLLGRYLQQLIMESLGKEKDLDGNVVHQGLTVYGNKGGTDAHAYIQQLNDGRNDFFVTFVEVLRDAAAVVAVDGLTMGEHLHAFKEGLATSLRSRKRKVIDIVIDRLDAHNLGMLIALYERAVAVYAELINVNAFHQPGVTAYKSASAQVNTVNHLLREWLTVQETLAPENGSARAVAVACGCAGQTRAVAGLLAKFAANEFAFGGRRLQRSWRAGRWVYRLT